MWLQILLLSVYLIQSNCRSENRQYPQLLRRGSSVLPPYMLNLYNRLKEDRVLPHGTANTIRSFVPVPGNLGENDVMVFNISGVHPSEYIERSEIHLRWARDAHQSESKFFKAKKRVLQLGLLNLNQQSEMQISPMIRRSGWSGWHTLDVTDSVISSLEDEDENNYLIGVTIHKDEDDDSDDGGGDLDDQDIHDVFSTAFLVIFSEDDDHLAIRDIREDGNDTVPSRGKRGLLDNELPDDLFALSKGAETQARLKHKPLEAMKSSKQSKKKKKRRQNKVKDHRSNELKWRKSWWKNGKQKGDEGDEEDGVQKSGARPGYDSLCQRKSLLVDFSRIGWNDWIIAPKRFDAYQCDGECQFPLHQEMQPTNYATLQGLLQSSENNDPSLCCVPQAFSAVPLLFYDQNRNVVLKKFPSMRVQSCTCR